MKYFTYKEFACKCGHCEADGTGINKTLVAKLDAVRERFGKPMHVTSACRCYTHNKAVGGSIRSMHLPQHGFRAADIACSNARDRYLLIKYAQEYGLTIGVNAGFLHFDCRDTGPLVFTY
jgi:hypothetical protein